MSGGAAPDRQADLWPSHLAFIASFMTIGVMWLTHHRLFTLIDKTDSRPRSAPSTCGERTDVAVGVHGAVLVMSAPYALYALYFALPPRVWKRA